MTSYTFRHVTLPPMDLARRLRSTSLPPYSRCSLTSQLRSVTLSLGTSINAMVLSRRDDDEWWHVRGPHEHGDLNDAGRDLLFFLLPMRLQFATHGSRMKISIRLLGNIQKQTVALHRFSNHAAITAQEVFRCGCVRGPQCNTDHQMIRMKLLAAHTKPYTRDHK